LINFLSLNALTINRVIDLSTLSSGYSKPYCRSGASRKWSGAVSGRRENDRAGDCGAKAERERGLQKEIWARSGFFAAHVPLMLRAHALVGPLHSRDISEQFYLMSRINYNQDYWINDWRVCVRAIPTAHNTMQYSTCCDKLSSSQLRVNLLLFTA